MTTEKTETEKAETSTKQSPYRILVAGAILTTVGSIITGVILSVVNNDDDKTATSGQSVQMTTQSGQVTVPVTARPAKATPMLDPAHRDMFVAELGYMRVDDGLDINGERFTYGASGEGGIGCGLDYEEFVEFNLGRDYKTFRATLGLSDSSPQGSAQRLRVLADGKLLYERNFILGESEAVQLDVTGALRLRVELIDNHCVFGAIGDPTVE